jgi:hypothetical protein
MERPERLAVGSAADDQLLEERLLGLAPDASHVVVAMAFLSPGRHAGQFGDVAQIVARVGEARPGLRIEVTGLLGDASHVRGLLAEQVRGAVAAGVSAAT